MPKVEEADMPRSNPPAGLAQEEIDAMMAEAIAVDALLQRKGRTPYDVARAISAYLAFPIGGKPGPDKDPR